MSPHSELVQLLSRYDTTTAITAAATTGISTSGGGTDSSPAASVSKVVSSSSVKAITASISADTDNSGGEMSLFDGCDIITADTNVSTSANTTATAATVSGVYYVIVHHNCLLVEQSSINSRSYRDKVVVCAQR